MSLPLISVIVCTYNRADLLASALQSLGKQTLESSHCEIVIVDNNSSDETAAVMEEFRRRYSNVRYYFEPRQGLSYARNRGYQVARGEYVAYIDDDCKAPEQWLVVAEEVIGRVAPGVFGGPYFAFYNTPKPTWFQDRYGSHFHGDEARPLQEGEFLDGANIFFRRVLLHDLGGFSPGLGMSGRKIGYGEETALQRRIRATKPEELIYYEPKLLVYHLVPPSKMTLRWIIRATFVSGQYYHLVFFGDKPLTMSLGQWLKQTVRTLRELCADIARGTVKRDRQRYPFLQNYLYEYAFVNLRRLGELYGQFLQMYGMRRWHGKGAVAGSSDHVAELLRMRMSSEQSTVFVVMPVFNRLSFTRECLRCLRAQTYSPLTLIVVDGGSTDGTAEVLHRDHPDVVVLQGQGELWWAGAMHVGIDYALAKSRNEDDMLLMMNNDTLIGPDYVETLVRVSRVARAAVGALIVDSRDPSRILDAGEFIEWRTYSFPVKTTVEPGETFFDGVDVLPGRGTLVPLRMIRAVGNINAEMFPHYVADYEFFSRLRRRGFRLGVTYEASIRSHLEETGLFIDTLPTLTFREALRLLFSVKSMHNVMDHWRFIDHCAPADLRIRLKLLVLWRSLCILVFKTKLKALVSPGYVTDSDCKRYGLDAHELSKEGILRPWMKDGWYVFAVPRRKWWASRPELRRLYVCAWNPIRKISRWLRVKMHGSHRVFVGALNKVPFGRQMKQAIKMCLALAPASWLRSLKAESPVDYTMLAARDALTYCQIEGKRVLVVGCNRGNDCTLFVEHGAGQVVGIDTIDEVGSAFRHSKAAYSQMSVESIGMKSGTCDLVFCFATMEHVSRIDLAFPEMARVTRPGGIIYCVAAPLWHSSQGHHKRDFFHSYPWIHLRLAPTEIVEYCRRNNIVDASGRHTMEEHVQYMMNPRYFNKMAGSEYLGVCKNLSDVEILRNELSFDHEELFSPEIYTELGAKGYSKAELLAVVHTFVARKVGEHVSPFVKAG